MLGLARHALFAAVDASARERPVAADAGWAAGREVGLVVVVHGQLHSLIHLSSSPSPRGLLPRYLPAMQAYQQPFAQPNKGTLIPGQSITVNKYTVVVERYLSQGQPYPPS